MYLSGFGMINKAEIDAFVEFSCFFYDPTDVGKTLVHLPFLNPAWTSGSFTVHVLLKPGLENFEHYFAYLFLLYWLCQSIDCVDHNKLWTIFQGMGIPDHLTRILGNLYAGQEATVRTRHGTGSKLRKECIKAVCCHPAYLTSMQSTSGELQAGWSTSWNQDCQEKYQ